MQFNKSFVEPLKIILDAIDATYEYVDVYEDDIVRDNIEEGLSKKPILLMSAEELINKMDFNI